jgi:chromosome segregation ATPase
MDAPTNISPQGRGSGSLDVRMEDRDQHVQLSRSELLNKLDKLDAKIQAAYSNGKEMKAIRYKKKYYKIEARFLKMDMHGWRHEANAKTSEVETLKGMVESLRAQVDVLKKETIEDKQEKTAFIETFEQMEASQKARMEKTSELYLAEVAELKEENRKLEKIYEDLRAHKDCDRAYTEALEITSETRNKKIEDLSAQLSNEKAKITHLEAQVEHLSGVVKKQTTYIESQGNANFQLESSLRSVQGSLASMSEKYFNALDELEDRKESGRKRSLPPSTASPTTPEYGQKDRATLVLKLRRPNGN